MATRSDRNWLNPLDLSGSEKPANVIGRQSAYPEPAGVGLAFGQHRHGRVVAVRALARYDMGLDQRRRGSSAVETAPTASAMVESAIGAPSSA
jgi:hypothetical protein